MAPLESEAEMSKSDSSVVVALSELVRLEESRVEEERAATAAREAERIRTRERAEADAREAEQRRLESAAHGARVADAEARLRLEADRDQGRRIDAMRAELARVEAERATLRASLEARIAVPESAPRVRGWAMAFGLSSLVAASLAGLLVMNAGETRTVIIETPRPALAVTAPIVAEAADAPEEIEVEQAPVISAAPAPRATVRTGTHRVRDHQRTEASPPPGDDLGLGADDGSTDVLSPEILRHAEHETHGARRAHR